MAANSETVAPVKADSAISDTGSSSSICQSSGPGHNQSQNPCQSSAPPGTSSSTTRILGWATLAGLALLVVFAFFVSPEDSRRTAEGEIIGQFDAVRLMYVHVPSAVFAYVSFSVTGLGSIVYLWRRSRWWDHVAHASAEIGVVFCGITLLTGIIWGRPVWNTWWEWGDVRLVTTLLLFLIFVGYLAFRAVPNEPHRQARNASILAIVGALNIPVVNRSVEWWENRTLHQQSTLADLKIEDETLLTLMIGFAVFSVLFLWLLIHRFRVAWLANEAAETGLEQALAERRAEAEQKSEAKA